MDTPRVHVRGKKDASKGKGRSDTLHWASRRQKPLPLEREPIPEREHKPEDYWTPYLQKRGRPIKKKKRRPKRRASSANATAPVKDNKQSLLKLIVSGGSAVLVGTLMGLIILNVFVEGSGSDLPNSIDTHTEGSAQTSESTDDDAAGSGSVFLPEVNPVWVQGGVYSSQEGADELAEAQRENGLAAVVLPMDGQYRVFFGVGLSEDDASDIAAQLEDEGLDVYLKDDLSVPSVSLSGVSAQQSQMLKQLAEAGQKAVNRLAALSTAGVGGQDISGNLRRDMESIERSHRTFLTAFGKVETALPDEQRQAVQVMDQSLAQAVEAIQQYDRESSLPYLWQVQEGIMHYLMAYRQLSGVD